RTTLRNCSMTLVAASALIFYFAFTSQWLGVDLNSLGLHFGYAALILTFLISMSILNLRSMSITRRL
ncbi:MAG: hypothetical protein VB957_04380, partial [Pseudomonadales bacterium]